MEIVEGNHDFYTNVIRALNEIDKKWATYPGLLIVGSHQPENTEQKIELIKQARESNIPFLGICMGMQLMIIEFARNVLGIADATSEEFGDGTHVIVKLPELRVGLKPVAKRLESHWHRYTFDLDYMEPMSRHGMDFMVEGDIAEVAAFRPNVHHVGCQFHPEYQSSKYMPHPILEGFLYAAKTRQAL